MKTYTAPDGTTWGVSIQVPGSSRAVIVFRHPGGTSARLDRYNWVISQGPEARSVTSRLDPNRVLDSLHAAEIARLFARSMPVSRQDPLTEAPEPVRG
ncbi:MAG TPA: hypothetical protein VF034_03405 [Gemmatimonadaceae bacterium]|jgi:hypothetical protein